MILNRANMEVDLDPFGSLDGLILAKGHVSIDLEKRRKSNNQKEIDKLKQRMAAHDGPPTKEEIAEHLVLTAGPYDNVSAIVADLSKKFAKVDGFGDPLRTLGESWFSSSKAPTDNFHCDEDLRDSAGL
jgi:hypothetical protein